MYCWSFCVTLTLTRPAACSGTMQRSSSDDTHTAGTRVVLKRTLVYDSTAERREKPAPRITAAVPPDLGPRLGAMSSRRMSAWYSNSTSSVLKS